MKSASSSTTFDEIRWGLNHDAFLDRTSKRLLRAWYYGARDPEVEELICGRVHPVRVADALGELVPFRMPRLHAGDIILGKDTQGRQVLIPHRWLGAGLLLAANTGSGKTNLLCCLLLQLATLQTRFWVVDLYKRQFRHLRTLCRRVGLNLVVLRPEQCRVNLLQANTADLRLHLAMVVDLLVRVLGLPPRARTIIHQGCHEVYRRFGLWDGHHDVWPTLYDLYEWVRTAPDLNAASREAILDRLATLLLSLTPRCAAYRKAWLAADLARYSIVFEMSGTSELVKQIVVEPLLYSLFLHEVQRGVINQPTRLFVFFEDGQRFFSTTHELASGEIAPMDELAGIIRGSAIGVGVNVQSTIGLSRRLVPNLATKFCGRLGSHEDYSSVGADLGLNSQQIDWWRLHSRPGMFLGQVAEGPWREPFLFQVPLLDVPAVVNDAEVAASVAELDALPVVPAQEFTHWEPRPVVEMKSETTTLSEVEIRFLQGVIKQPGQSSTYYATQAGLNGQTAAKVRTRLVDLGHIREHSVATGRRGRMALILEPLPSASAAIGTTAPEGV